MTTTTQEIPGTDATLTADADASTGRIRLSLNHHRPSAEPTSGVDLIDARWAFPELLAEWDDVGEPRADVMREMLECQGADVTAGQVSESAFDREVITAAVALAEHLASVYRRYGYDAESDELATLEAVRGYLASPNESMRAVVGVMHTRCSDRGGSAAGEMAGIALGLGSLPVPNATTFRQLANYSVRWIVRDLAHLVSDHEGVSYAEGAARASIEIRRALSGVSR